MKQDIEIAQECKMRDIREMEQRLILMKMEGWLGCFKKLLFEDNNYRENKRKIS
ncbi:MAG: hypothetical protein AB1397_00850 [bacterium]